MALLILDGRVLARTRAIKLRRRAQAVTSVRGTCPRLLLLAFQGPGGRVPWVSKKIRACDAAGIQIDLLVLDGEADTVKACTALERALERTDPDGVFLQIPFPSGVDGNALISVIPPLCDVDTVSPQAMTEYLSGRTGRPPLTVAAGLALLEAYGLRFGGHPGVVVGDLTPFNRMFARALEGRGARTEVVSPAATDLSDYLSAASLVVTSAAQPGVVRSTSLAGGAVAVDGGYYNPGGQGDFDISGGVEHLRALAPVPGGIGPMTVSMLVEAVIDRAETAVRAG